MRKYFRVGLPSSPRALLLLLLLLLYGRRWWRAGERVCERKSIRRLCASVYRVCVCVCVWVRMCPCPRGQTSLYAKLLPCVDVCMCVRVGGVCECVYVTQMKNVFEMWENG